jgi:hypothetical protein
MYRYNSCKTLDNTCSFYNMQTRAHVCKHVCIHGMQGAFEQMEFEYPRNNMQGSFDYKAIKGRLVKIREAIDEETKVSAHVYPKRKCAYT